jgi:hypothetical protein
MTNPWTCSFEEASTDTDPMAVGRWATVQRLQAGRERFEQRPLEGIALCCQWGLEAPDWLASAFLHRYSRVAQYEVASLDEAFGSPRVKGQNLSRARARERLGSKIFMSVIEAARIDPNVPIADAIEAAAMKHGAGRTLADEIYRDACKRYGFNATGLKAAGLRRMNRGKQPANSRKLAVQQNRR